MQIITITGNLGADAEVRYTTDGKRVVTFRVGCSGRKRNRDTKEWESHSEWYRVTVFGSDGSFDRTEYAARFQKGNKVTVVGRIEFDSYIDRDGEKQFTKEIYPMEFANQSPIDQLAERDDDGDKPAPAAQSRPVPAVPSGGSRPTQGQSSTSRRQTAPTPADLDNLPF